MQIDRIDIYTPAIFLANYIFAVINDSVICLIMATLLMAVMIRRLLKEMYDKKMD